MEENKEINQLESENTIGVKGLLTEDQIRKKKSRKTKTAISVFVLLLAVGLGGNWYWENSDISTKISTITASNKTLGEATFVDAPTEVTTENDYFSSARVDRQKAHDSALEELQQVISATSEDEEARKVASEGIAKLSSVIEMENKIETLVCAKGVNNCIAVVDNEGTRVDVIIDVSELTDDIILQIKEIATEQLSCGFENVTIIQSN